MDFADRWKYSVDRDATVVAYAQIASGYSDSCDCSGCRNFRLVREQVFPPDFIKALDALGIDPNKDGEIYYLGPTASGRHTYGGWYHFIGTLEESRTDRPPIDFGNGFTAWLQSASAPRLASLKDKPVVQLEIQCESVPWLLDEPPPI